MDEDIPKVRTSSLEGKVQPRTKQPEEVKNENKKRKKETWSIYQVRSCCATTEIRYNQTGPQRNCFLVGKEVLWVLRPLSKGDMN